MKQVDPVTSDRLAFLSLILQSSFRGDKKERREERISGLKSFLHCQCTDTHTEREREIYSVSYIKHSKNNETITRMCG